MVYKRYIRRNGKLVGPYYYKTVKEKNGKTRTIYIGRTVPVATREEKTTPFYEGNVSQLKKNIQLCEAKKEILRINLNKILLRYQNKEISYGQYELLKNKYLRGKTPEYWYDYYDSYKGKIHDQIRKYLFASSCLEYIKTVSDAGKELEKAGEEKQRIPQVFQKKILQLQNNALICEQRKLQIRKRLQEYKQRYDNNLIKYSQYELLKNSYLKGKTPEYWFSYYDHQKLDLQEQINKYEVSSTCEGYAKEIFEAKPSLKDKVLTEIVKEDLELEEPKFYDKHKSLTQIVSVLIIALILIPSLLLTAPMINSFFSKEQPLDLINLEFSVVKGVSVVKGFVDETVFTNLPKKQQREQQELKKSYEKEVEKPEEKTVEEQQTHEQEPNIVSKIVEPITEFFGATTPTSFAITEENITTPYTILPEENVIIPSENVTTPEENVTLPEENITLPEENVIIPEENITIPEENITLPEENITIPEGPVLENLTEMLTSIEDELKAKSYKTNLKLKNLIKKRDKFDLEIESDDKRGSLLIRGLDNASDIEDIQITMLVDNRIKDGRITTPIVSAGVTRLENATITLAKEGDVNAIVKCENWNFTTSTCEQWTETEIPFVDDGENITFTVTEFSGYAGAEITIINVQSYPVVGGEWTVRFNTTGTANLTITPVNNTIWANEGEDKDLEFLEVRCGDSIKEYEWVDNSVFIQDYECDETGYETSKVLTTGKHHLKFQFGEDIDYAHNEVTINHVESFAMSSNGTAVSSLTIKGVSGGTNLLYLVVGTGYNQQVNKVDDSSGSLTWSLLKSQCTSRLTNPNMSLWQAFGSPTGSFDIYVNFTGTNDVATAIASVYSGADTTTPTENVNGSNTLGWGNDALCSGGSDTTNLNISLTSTVDNSVLYVASYPRISNSLATEDPDYTQRASALSVNGGNGANTFVHDRNFTTAGTDMADHTISASRPWMMLGVVIRPASTNAAPDSPNPVVNFTYDNLNYTNESMWCQFNISDSDTETQMYVNLSLINNTADSDYVEQWKLTDLPYSDETQVNFEIKETNFTKGDFVVCQVQVCDDESSCSSFVNSSSLKVENYPVQISDPLGNWSNVNENAPAFTLDWTNNYTDVDDVEGKEAYTNWTYEINDTTILTISVNNDTDVVTITPIANAFGSVEINWTVLDDENAQYNETVVWTVNSVNDAPAILDISDIPGVTLSEGLATPIEFSFLADDQDGTSNLINESTQANFSKTGENTRWNTTNCVAVSWGSNATTLNYTCTIDMQYWDGSGTWVVDVQAGDNNVNASLQETFTINSLTAINITAATLSWPSLNVGNIDQLMSTAELNVTNIGNQNLTSITLEAINLIGETTPTVWIPAANFTATWGERSCNTGTAMVNDTAITITGSKLDYGPGSLEPTNNATHICLEEVGQDISQQAYSTAGDVEDWTLMAWAG